jgi:pyruvate dehydrogenase E1 component alpha subunit
MAADLRERMHTTPELDPMDLFAHVYAEPTPQLREQQAQLRAELDAEHDSHGGAHR